MKAKFLLLSFLMIIGMMSCSDEDVSGVATYQKNLFVEGTISSSITKNTPVGDLYEDYKASLKEITQKYGKEWDYSFSGSSINKALASEDQSAISDFDAAVTELKALGSQLNATEKGLDGGSFKEVYKFKVIRMGETIKSSDELVFQYGN